MATIGSGWVTGSWITASWVNAAWAGGIVSTVVAGVVWTRRSDPVSTTTWLELHVKFRKRSDFFYESLHGVMNGLIPTKNSTNFFYTMAGGAELGSFAIGRRTDDFIQGLAR